MKDDFEKSLERSLEDPEFKRLWEEDELEYQIISELIALRSELNLTQEQLSQITGVRQSNISRIECGNSLPSLRTLQKIADATGKKLKLEFQ